MKYLGLAVIAFCLLFIVQNAYGQERPFGLGVMIGEPTGISAKLWTSNSNAFDFGLGWSTFGNRYNSDNRIHLHADYLWHAWNTIHATERFPLYYGLGARLIGGGNESSIAIRGVFGIAWMPRQTPIDIFFELAPSIELTPSSGFALDAAIGVRYYF